MEELSQGLNQNKNLYRDTTKEFSIAQSLHKPRVGH